MRGWTPAAARNTRPPARIDSFGGARGRDQTFETRGDLLENGERRRHPLTRGVLNERHLQDDLRRGGREIFKGRIRQRDMTRVLKHVDESGVPLGALVLDSRAPYGPRPSFRIGGGTESRGSALPKRLRPPQTRCPPRPDSWVSGRSRLRAGQGAAPAP